MSDRILLIDFMNYLHRCRVGKLEGEYVLIYNFFRNLRATVEQFQPTKVIFVLDGHAKHRYEISAEYKANRIIKTGAAQTTNEQVFKSADSIKQLLQLLPVTLAYHPDFEADDLIYTLVDNLKEEDVIIVSGDSDFIQLLQKDYSKLKLYNPFKKEYIEPPPFVYMIFKILWGDKSDNIKGLMSENKAIKVASDPKLLQEFLSQEERRASFNINRSLIEMKLVPSKEIEWVEGSVDFDALQFEFAHMEFETIINDR